MLRLKRSVSSTVWTLIRLKKILAADQIAEDVKRNKAVDLIVESAVVE